MINELNMTLDHQDISLSSIQETRPSSYDFADTTHVQARMNIPSDFLELGIGILSRNSQQNNGRSVDEGLGKFREEVATSFIGLGIGPTTEKINLGHDKLSKRKKQQNPNKKRAKRIRADDTESVPEPEIPCPELLQIIGPEIRPVLLYRKKLKKSDANKQHNRLLVNRMEKLMGFLTEEERQDVNSDGKKPGMEVIAIDSMGRKFSIGCKIWKSFGKVVFKKSWHAMVEANGAMAGHIVHVWDYRKDDGVFRLAIEFLDH